jgi:hypothetical protein
MSTVINGATQNEVEELESLTNDLYENIFKINLIDKAGNDLYFYNLLNKVVFPDNISDEIVSTFIPQNDVPWTMLSYQLYGTINLWWTVYLLNKPDYIFMAKAATEYKYIKPGAMKTVLKQITLNK